MEDLLNRLEHQIRTLLYQHDHLKQSHESLKVKQHKAISQINSLVTMLKTIEKLP